jgi:hypothetical protein
MPGKQCRDLKLKKVRIVVGFSTVVQWPNVKIPSLLNMLLGVSEVIISST